MTDQVIPQCNRPGKAEAPLPNCFTPASLAKHLIGLPQSVHACPSTTAATLIHGFRGLNSLKTLKQCRQLHLDSLIASRTAHTTTMAHCNCSSIMHWQDVPAAVQMTQQCALQEKAAKAA